MNVNDKVDNGLQAMNASLLSHTIDKNKTKDDRLIAATAYRYSDMSYQNLLSY
ncbi:MULTISPECIES: hypothetical protein [Psychrobacter]|uniref:hypothetical protein n=1 Tax=Psychrobacter TaxID=497 RepID=UPI0012EAD47E|nr:MULTISPECIES: hypothetical protein [Psychrobacter]MDE0843328.1 hypothetical protein [Psychrobacter pacificensis]MED6317834.1 hypothetical protein [Pseudomonadota bacterium]